MARAEFLRTDRLTLDPSRPLVSLIARDLPGGPEKSLPFVGAPRVRAPGDPPAAWVSEAVAAVYAYQPGTRVQLAVGGELRTFVIDGVWRDYARQHGAIVIDRADFVRLTGDRRVNDAALYLKPGVSEARLEAALRALPGRCPTWRDRAKSVKFLCRCSIAVSR